MGLRRCESSSGVSNVDMFCANNIYNADEVQQLLCAAGAASDKGAVGVLASASSVIRALNAVCAGTAGLAIITARRESVCCLKGPMVIQTGEPTSRRKSSSQFLTTTQSHPALCRSTRCKYRMAHRKHRRTGDRSRRRRKSDQTHGCCMRTQRPGWMWRLCQRCSWGTWGICPLCWSCICRE